MAIDLLKIGKTAVRYGHRLNPLSIIQPDPFEPIDIINQIKNRTIGKEWKEDEIKKAKQLWNLIPKDDGLLNIDQESIKSGAQATGQFLGDVYTGARTVKKWHSPLNWGHNVGALGIRGIEGAGYLSRNVIGRPAEWTAHNVLRIDKDLSTALGVAAEMYISPKAASGAINLANKAIASPTAHKLAFGAGQRVNQLTQGFKPVNQRTVNAQAYDPSKRIVSETSASVLGKNSIFKTGSKAEKLAIEQLQINKALQGDPTASVMLSINKPSRVFETARSAGVKDLRTEVLNRTKELLKEKNLSISQYSKIRRQLSKEYNDVVMDGEGRVLSGISQALQADDASKIEFPLAKTVQRGRESRSEVTAPAATVDQIDLARDIGMPEELIPEMVQDGLRSFADVQRGAKRQSSFPREYHAGHLIPAKGKPLSAMELNPRSRKEITSNIDDLMIPKEPDVPGRMRYPATTGDTAGIELGRENIVGSNKIEHSVNLHAAREVGIPDDWATWQKNWWKRRQGKPTKDFFSDWNNAERSIIMDIPHNWSRKQVLGFLNDLKKARAMRGDMGYKQMLKELKQEVSVVDDLTISEREIKKLLKSDDPTIKAMREKLLKIRPELKLNQ